MSLRILVLTPSYPLPESPGAAEFVHRQVEALSNAGATCRVVVPQARPRSVLRRWTSRSFVLRWLRAARGGAVGSVPVVRVPYDRGTSPDEDIIPSQQRTLLKRVTADAELSRSQVILAHWIWPSGAAALPLGEALGVPVAAIGRGGDLNEGGWYGARETCRTHVRETLPRLHLPLANCRYLRQRMEEISPGTGRRTRVVYNGCDARWWSPEGRREVARAALGLGAGDRLLVFCGDVSASKGMRVLAAAFRRLLARDGRWRLALLGPTVDPPLAAEVRRELGAAVRILGRTPPEGVRETLAAADGYVQPSFAEGLANATIEAMAMGLPVISSRCCGQVEAVDGTTTGWLVEPGDTESLAEALLELAADPGEAARRGRAARAHVLGNFDAERQIRRLLRLLEGLANRGPRRPERPTT